MFCPGSCFDRRRRRGSGFGPVGRLRPGGGVWAVKAASKTRVIRMDFICRCSDYASCWRYAGSGSLVKKTEFENSVGIAGTGRVAKAIGALLVGSGVRIGAIAGRSGRSADVAVRFTGADRAVPIRELPRYARHLVIAVTDDAIPEVAAELLAGGLEDGVVLHTSGAAGMEVLNLLRAAGNSVGVLHPLMTMPSAERGMRRFREQRRIRRR